MGGCVASKQQKRNLDYLKNKFTAQQAQIKIRKSTKRNANSITEIQVINTTQQRQPKIQLKIQQKRSAQQKTINSQKSPKNILDEIVKLSQLCIIAYENHQIDQAHNFLIKIQNDLKQLSKNGYIIQITNEHFRQQFLELIHKIQMEYKDMIDFNNEILQGKWKVKKQKKNFKVSSKVQGDDVGILLQSILQVPFQYFIAVMIQMDLYKQFLPFIIKSEHLKDVSRNCKLGFLQLQLPIISNRQSYFQGIIYNRLKNQKNQDQQLFMYTRSIHNRLDLQKMFDYDILLNKKCVAFEYKYIAVKYVPLTQNSGKMIMGVNIDLKLNLIPLSIIQLASISFSEDFYNQIVRISKKFQGSPWQQGIKRDPQLFQFLKKVKNQYLQKKINKESE